MWVSMEVHTADTIKEGHKELLRFSKLIKVRIIFTAIELYDHMTNGLKRNMLKLKGHLLMWKINQILNSLQLKISISQKCMVIAIFLTTF
jgi:hypothetical protein